MLSLNTNADLIYRYNEARLKETKKLISFHKITLSKQFKVLKSLTMLDYTCGGVASINKPDNEAPTKYFNACSH